MMPNRSTWNNGYLVVPQMALRPWQQRLAAAQPMRQATCEEVACEWWAFGKDGMDEGHSFRHPAGVRCGDFSRCLPCSSPIVVRTANGGTRKRLCGACPPCKAGTSNCPCSGRKANHKLPATAEYEDRVIDPVARAHFRPLPVLHRRTVVQHREVVSREIVPAEFRDRIAEGLDARNHILTRGL